jgi:hypothetical protein
VRNEYLLKAGKKKHALDMKMAEEALIILRELKKE